MSKRFDSKINGIFLLSILLLLQGCGGGGGSSSGAGTLSIGGIAAQGAPMTGAKVQIYDATGAALLATPVIVASDGSYSATIPDNAKFPLVLITDDGVNPMVSVVPDATQARTVNVNQLTHLIASRLSKDGDPIKLVTEISTNQTTVTGSEMSAQTRDLTDAIQPLLQALSLSSTINPQTVNFAPNGTGFDKLLDTLDVKVTPKGDTATIDLTVRKSIPEGGELPSVSFNHTDGIATLPQVRSADLMPDGLSVNLQQLLDQMTSCYALTKEQRVRNTQGVASDIIATACQDIFWGRNPAAYKSNGAVVAYGQHFNGIFTAPPGVKFIAPKYFYTVAESVPNGPSAGDVVFGYRWQDEFGNFQYDKSVARRDTDGRYRIIGNQYRYPGGVSPYAQRRQFTQDAAYTYDSVGYVFDLPCNNYTKNWVKVVVTSPPFNDRGDQGTITMRPNLTGGVCNYSYFTVSFDGQNPSGTGFIRLQSKYVGVPPVSHPRVKEGSFLAFVDDDFTDAQLERLPQFGTWKFEYFFNGNNTDSPNATQYFKTTARARTVDSFRASVPLPAFTMNFPSVNYQVAGSLTLVQHPSIGYFVPTGNKVDLSWRVASDDNPLLKGSEPATYRARIYGSYGGATTFVGGRGIRSGYEDSVIFGAASRRTSIFCGEGNAAPQCEGGNFRSSPFATTVTEIDLVSRVNDGSDASHFYTFRKFSN